MKRNIWQGVFVLMALGVLRVASEPAPAGHKLDWYAWGEISAAPYLTDVRALSDGDPATVCAHMDGPQVGGWVAFAFPKMAHVTALRLRQDGGRAADAFELRADLEGKGDYAHVIATVRHDAPVVDEWLVIPVDREVRGLRISALSGSVGYRSPYPVYKDIEIYTQTAVPVEAPTLETAPQVLRAGDVGMTPDLSRKQIPFTPCIDLWMADIHGNAEMPETRADIEALGGFQRLLGQLRAMDAQGVRMFLENASVQNKMPWTSAVAPHYGRDTLRGLIEALHANGLTAGIFMHVWNQPFQDPEKMLPMPDRRWDYPYEQSSTVAAKGLYEGYEKDRYPCVISDNHFRDHWFAMLKEVVERGIDTVYAIPDEYYFKGHDLDSYHCPSCQREFKKRYGYDTLPPLGPGRTGYSPAQGVGPEPRRVADTEHFRKWKLFEYEMLAELFNDVAGRLKQVNPNLVLVSSANPGSTYGTNRRLEHGLAFDIIGKGTNFNAVQLYASVPVGLGDMGANAALARRMRGSYRQAELVSSIQSLGFNLLPPAGNEIRFFGYVLPHIMSGASRIDLYRLNYVTGDWLPVIPRGIALVRVLESWGIGESVSAAETCLLLSRASEDWWQVRAQALCGLADDAGAGAVGATVGGAPLLHFEEQIGTISTLTPSEADLKLDLERFRGMYAGKSMESLLIENGVQYDVRYTEREETLEDLSRYRLLILPFSYAMSVEAFNRVKQAVDRGTRLLIFDQLAPTDEYGTAHPEPLLKALVGRPGVVYVNLNLAAEGMRSSVRAKSRQALLRLLGDAGGYFQANEARVEYLSRRTDEGMILYLANWERSRVAEPVVGLTLPEGRYQMQLVRSGNTDVFPGKLGDATEMTADALRRFGVRIEPGEVVLIRVARQP